MKYLADSKITKEIDRCSIEIIGISSMVLMERAAFCVAEKIIANESVDSKIIAVCGCGNNGGDGIAVARILHEKGYDVCIFIAGSKDNATVETSKQIEIARKSGIRFTNDMEFSEYNIVIDAIFGIGLSREVSGIYAKIIDCINNITGKVIYSVDVPSGVCVDNGKIMGKAIHADYTITFGLNKIGLMLYPANDYCGKIYVEDIGFPKVVIEEVLSKYNNYLYYKDINVKDILPIRINNSNKGTYGKILVVAGGYNMAGAAVLSAKAAYKSGAGLVKIFTCEENRTIIQSSVPEAILQTYSRDDIKEINIKLMEAVEWADCIVIGPGIGVNDISKELVSVILKSLDKPVILDADALNIISASDDLFLRENIIITPHLKEYSKLVDISIEELINNKLDCLYKTYEDRLSQVTNIVLVLKDARTLVYNGDKTYVNISGNNGMSTAGSGDVLTGIIAAFVASGQDLFEAAINGVYTHGLAGDYFANNNNVYSLMAGNIIDSLDKILK